MTVVRRLLCDLYKLLHEKVAGINKYPNRSGVIMIDDIPIALPLGFSKFFQG
jgi:hypothetical protein